MRLRRMLLRLAAGAGLVAGGSLAVRAALGRTRPGREPHPRRRGSFATWPTVRRNPATAPPA